MKKQKLNFRRMVVATVFVSACCIAWITPSLTGNDNEKDKPKQAATATEPINVPVPASRTEEEVLVQQLEADGLINQVRGFLVEKRKTQLIVNGAVIPADVAGKYISTLKKETIFVQVHSLGERMRQHPDANFIQLLMPVMMSSPCVDNKPKGGC